MIDMLTIAESTPGIIAVNLRHSSDIKSADRGLGARDAGRCFAGVFSYYFDRSFRRRFMDISYVVNLFKA